MKVMATQQANITLEICKTKTFYSFYLLLDNKQVILNIDIKNKLIDRDDIDIYMNPDNEYYDKEENFLTLEEMMFNEFYKTYFANIYEILFSDNDDEYLVNIFLNLLKQLIKQINGDVNEI